MSAVVLFLYAIPFSYAYGLLTAGTGALILFGTVQVIDDGDRAHARRTPSCSAMARAVDCDRGLVYLLLPGLTAPSPLGATLMAMSGVAWAIYTIRGRGAVDPLAQNAGNFVRSIPLTLAVSLAAVSVQHSR